MDGNGSWMERFNQERAGGRSVGGTPSSTDLPREQPDDDGLQVDRTAYRPWVLQRGRGPSMLLDLRRYEPKSGMWSGRVVAYPHLAGLEYTGDRMVSLDFGKRCFVLTGQGLDELVRHLQRGIVMAVQEYAQAYWPQRPNGPMISAIHDLRDKAPQP